MKLSIVLRKARLSMLRTQLQQTLLHSTRPVNIFNLRKINAFNPVPSVLKHIPSSQRPSIDVPDTAMECHSFNIMSVDPTMQDVVVVEHHLAGFQLHGKLGGHVGLERICVLFLCG